MFPDATLAPTLLLTVRSEKQELLDVTVPVRLNELSSVRLILALNALPRFRQPRRGIHLPSGRTQKAESRHHDMGGLQEGRSSPCRDGTPRNGRRQAGAGLLLGRVRQAGGFRRLDKGAIISSLLYEFLALKAEAWPRLYV